MPNSEEIAKLAAHKLGELIQESGVEMDAMLIMSQKGNEGEAIILGSVQPERMVDMMAHALHALNDESALKRMGFLIQKMNKETH